MVCSKCGSQQAEGARFCSSCGAAFAVLSHPANDNTQQMYRAGRGGVVLTLGILSLLIFGPITGIPAWVMGYNDLKQIDAGLMLPSERGMTNGGMILGIIGTCLGTLIMLGIFLSIVVAVMSMSAR